MRAPGQRALRRSSAPTHLTGAPMLPMLLSSRCEYALRATLHLATLPAGSYAPVREISAALGIPQAFLSKIVQTLAQAGLVATLRGPGGGIALARRADAIPLGAVVEAIDGREIFDDCVMGLPGCGMQAPCPLHEAWVPVRERLRALFLGTTLAAAAADLDARGYRLADLLRERPRPAPTA